MNRRIVGRTREQRKTKVQEERVKLTVQQSVNTHILSTHMCIAHE